MYINQICMLYADLSLLCLASGYALSSVEGRVSMEFFDLSESAQSKKYVFCTLAAKRWVHVWRLIIAQYYDWTVHVVPVSSIETMDSETSFANTLSQFPIYIFWSLKGGPGVSGRVLSPVTGRSRVQVAVSSHCTGEGKACHWHPSPDPAQSGSSLHWVRPFFYIFWSL